MELGLGEEEWLRYFSRLLYFNKSHSQGKIKSFRDAFDSVASAIALCNVEGIRTLSKLYVAVAIADRPKRKYGPSHHFTSHSGIILSFQQHHLLLTIT